MYIIELIFKLKEKYQKGGMKGLFDLKKSAGKNFALQNTVSPNTTAGQGSDVHKEDFEAEYETCEHIFRPIDSTNTVLACVKCGYLIHCSEDEFKKKNIFKKKLKK